MEMFKLIMVVIGGLLLLFLVTSLISMIATGIFTILLNSIIGYDILAKELFPYMTGVILTIIISIGCFNEL